MSTLISRPKRGLPPEEALARWSDPGIYADLIEIVGTKKLPQRSSRDYVIRDPPLKEEYWEKRQRLERAFHDQLRDGDILSSAIADFAQAREILDPSLWEMLWINYSTQAVYFEGRTYSRVEFFDRTGIPQNIRSIPAWLDAELAAAGMNVFRHDRSYRHVVLHGHEFALSDLQGKIVMILHQAFLAGDPWQYGQKVLERAGSSQLKLGDVFKSRRDWKLLIESRSEGTYRLRMDPPLDSV